MRHFVLVLGALCLLVGFASWNRSSPAPVATAEDMVAPFVLDNFYRGVCWVGGRRNIQNASFDTARETGIDWISQSPFGWMDNQYSPEVRLNRKARLFNESDNGVRATTQAAHASGMKVMLKPHIWLSRPLNNGWIGEIDFETEEEWSKWEDSYRNFIMHYARVAEEERVDMFCIATELSTPVRTRPAFWKGLVAEIRGVYSGELTYAANWWRDYDETDLWEDLDYIGVNAYFPLTDKANPSVEELVAGWQPHLEQIEQVALRFNKPVLFTEIGYKNIKGTSIKPWEWPRQVDSPALDASEQVNAYEALFLTFGQKPWFRGTFIWKWFSRTDRMSSDRVAFTPQNRAAEETLKKWYTYQGAPKPR
ncbi:MAG: glycoside hydrolase [Candidatus Latescibacteria bacterium]|nr:glycoside hydrolase [Candidatus Latescibacterota bacterium]